jgi:hypothetical protein
MCHKENNVVGAQEKGCLGVFCIFGTVSFLVFVLIVGWTDFCQWFCSCLLLVVGWSVRYRLSLSRWLMLSPDCRA